LAARFLDRLTFEISFQAYLLLFQNTSCIQARDDFYKCVADAGIVFSLDLKKIPKECLKQRQVYESSCKASWVRHFDISQDKELRILKTLRNNINSAAATATGGLQGTDHREQ
jgi:Cytochrome oxidase c subunit VIb